MYVVSSFSELEKTRKDDPLSIVYKGSLSYPLHVAVNPVIYSIIDRAFMEELKRVFFCCKCKGHCGIGTELESNKQLLNELRKQQDKAPKETNV